MVDREVVSLLIPAETICDGPPKNRTAPVTLVLYDIELLLEVLRREQ